MFLKIGRKIINTENLVDADVFEVGESLSPYRGGQAEERTVVITTTAVEAERDGSGVLAAHKIVLEGEDADLFIESLPVYTPALEES